MALDLTVSRPDKTLRDQVATILRDAIITGTFAPGVRLVERQLCDRLGVSRPLLREALRQLQAEGWVNAQAPGGLAVATISAQSVRELYQVRAALEGLAAQLCAEHASNAELDRMEAAIRALAAAQQRGDRDGQREQAGLFYDLLRQAGGNTLLQSQLAALSARAAWMRTIAFARPERARASVREEITLMAALKERDGARARKLCAAHLDEAARSMIEALAPKPKRSTQKSASRPVI